MKVILFITYALFLVTLNPMGCNKIKSTENLEKKNIMNINNSDLDTATLGTGCFWCTEAIFERVNGVVSVISGYSGGNIANPTY
ncbi:MAG TPA: peptide-methionine (S)-S-oxide reductase, partial [Ignavibacteriaceae bacterium]|nr:peptide-methionine (S)-S-oxide reductase [Ignavibacteriaceae bacterium]